jgi:hypothetical protein
MTSLIFLLRKIKLKKMKYNNKKENAMKKDLKFRIIGIVIGILFCQTINVFAIDGGKWSNREWKRVLDLRGHWKFEIGDDMDWAKPDYNDKDWETIFVPNEWEDEGFPGYDGFAWYRRTFTTEDLIDRDNLYLRLGYIDDCDEVYINGHLVGHHGWFPPNYETAYQYDRIYYIHEEYLNPEGVNTLAVRVYDSQMAGGIVRGDIGFYTKRSFLSPQIDLSGIWKFKSGDEMEWKEEEIKDADWNGVLVPAFWSQYGLKDYDGFGWYRKEFKIPAHFEDERLILLLGKIDDMDEVYLNGKKIGGTGRMRSHMDKDDINYSDYVKDRAYTIPPSYLNKDGINTIAVRVFDGWLYGGIYDGPIGIVTRDRYVEWQRDFGSDKTFKNIFEMFFGE